MPDDKRIMAVLLPVVLGILWSGVQVQGQKAEMAACPNPQPPRIHESKLQRVWYQFEGVPTFFNKGASCITLDFRDFPRSFRYCSVGKEKMRRSCIQGEIKTYGPYDAGKYSLVFDARSQTVETNSTVVYLTDNMLMSYGCLNLPCLPKFRAGFLSLYSRWSDGQVDPWELAKAYYEMEKLGIDPDKDMAPFSNSPCLPMPEDDEDEYEPEHEQEYEPEYKYEPEHDDGYEPEHEPEYKYEPEHE